MSHPFHSLLSLTLFAGISLMGCAGEETSSFDKADEKSDAVDRLCEQAGLESDCDICAVKGWLVDDECDDFCLTPDPVCSRAPNPACNEALDEWMFDCIDSVLDNGDALSDAIFFCRNGAIDGEPLEEAGICHSSDSACLFTMAENAEVCAEAVGAEFAPPSSECLVPLDEWMRECIEVVLEQGDALSDAIFFCRNGAIDGEPLEEAGICSSGDTDCLLSMADNAEDCAAAIGAEFE